MVGKKLAVSVIKVYIIDYPGAMQTAVHGMRESLLAVNGLGKQHGIGCQFEVITVMDSI